MRFLPEGGALLVSDAARRCGDVRTLLDACRMAGFAAEERDGLLLLTPTNSTLSALCGACRQAVRITDWDEEKASAAAFSVRLTRRKDAPLTADGRRLVLETLRLLSQDDAHILMGMAGIRARAAAQLRRKDESGMREAGALIAEWYMEKGGHRREN